MKRILLFFCAMLVIVQLFSLAGCSSRFSGSSPGTAAKGYQAATGNQTADTTGVTNGTAKTDDAATTTESPANTSSSITSNSRKIVRTADVIIETLTYDKSVAGIESVVSQYGGYVQSSSVQGTGVNNGGSNKVATYALRIPSDSLDSFLNSVGSIGTVVSKNITGQDVTNQYYDSSSRLDMYKAEEARLLEMMEKSSSMSDMLKIEERLTEVQTEIDQLTGTLKQYDSLVDLSTVNITLREVTAVTKTSNNNFGSQIAEMFANSANALAETLKTIVIVLVAILPFLAFLGAVFGIVVLIIKLVNRNKNKTPKLPK